MRSGQRATGNGQRLYDEYSPPRCTRICARISFYATRCRSKWSRCSQFLRLFRLFSGIDDGIYKKNLGLVTLGSPMPMGWRIYALRIAIIATRFYVPILARIRFIYIPLQRGVFREQKLTFHPRTTSMEIPKMSPSFSFFGTK